MKIHSVKYNFVMNTILKMSAFLFPLITFPYVSRVLGVVLNGRIAFASSYVAYFTMVAQLGIPTYGIRACAKVRDDRIKLSRTVQELLIINSCMVVFSYLSLIITLLTVPKIIENRPLVIISSVSVILTCIGMEWFYQATEQYDYITFRNIIFKLLSIGLMFVFVREPSDYIKYAGINVLGSVGSNVLNFIRIGKYVSLKPIKGLEIKRHFRPILSFFLFTVSATIYTSLDSVMLGFLSTDKQVGLYTASIKMRNILFSLVTSIGTVLLPRASYLINNKEFEQFKGIIKKSLQFILVMSVPLTIFFSMKAKSSILFLSGDEYIDATLSMIIVTPTILVAGISNLTGIQVLIPVGYEKFIIFSTFGGALTDLILNSIFIPRLGAAGAAIGTIVAEIVVLGIQLILMKKQDLIHYVEVDWINIMKIVGAGILAGFSLALISTRVCNEPPFVQLCICAVVFFGVYATILLVSRECILWQYGIETISKMIKPNERR